MVNYRYGRLGRACIRAGGRAGEWGVEEGEREDMQVHEVERAGVRGRAGRSTGEGAQERRREGGQGGAWLHIDQLAHPISIIYIYIYISMV